jgi:hypothetical protein
VPELAAVLLAVRLRAPLVRIVDPDDELVLVARADEVRDVEREGVVAAPVRPEEDAVDVDPGLPVHGLEVERDLPRTSVTTFRRFLGQKLSKIVAATGR